MLVISLLMQNIAKNFSELILVLRVHVAANMLGLFFKLPFKATLRLAIPIYHKNHCIHVEVHRELILFALLPGKVEHIVFIFLCKGDSAVGQSG